MCAIGGWLVDPRASPDKTALDRMMAVMAHRGPDDAGSLFDTREKAVWAFYKRSPQGDGNTP